jgi:murein DD-endopeptidase MepM/ murein hydrolase activator NlpD
LSFSLKLPTQTPKRPANAGHSHYAEPNTTYVTLKMRTVWLCATLFVTLTVWSAGSAWFFLCRDNLIARVLHRQADVQYAYEDQITGLRAQVDKIASRQLLSQDSFEGRVEQLFARQAKLESRHALVLSLAEGVSSSLGANLGAPAVNVWGGSAGDMTSSLPLSAKSAKANTGKSVDALTPPSAQGVPLLSTAAPLPSKPQPINSKPQPEPSEPALEPPALRGVKRTDVQGAIVPMGGPFIPANKGVAEKIVDTEKALSRIETTQVKALNTLHQQSISASAKWRTLFTDLGISVEGINQQIARALEKKAERFSKDTKGDAFESKLQTIRPLLNTAIFLRKALTMLPIKRPLSPDYDITSSFGLRSDPFTRGQAMHSGIDFRGETGTPVKVTAAGVVIKAHYSGGYGNLVEVMHDNGISTRYAHLSAFDVVEGQKITLGQTVGRIGSTGRSTAPHLHYEVRINGDAVDPMRFIRTGTKVSSR